MAWLRIGDNVTTHPKTALLLEKCDFAHHLKNECFGLFVGLAAASAAHLTDYIVEPGLISMLAPGREKVLIGILKSTGLIKPVEVDDRWMYELYNDEEFVHMRTKDEVEIDRARKRDSRRPELIVPVRVRDGDSCRWCGKTVSWDDRKSARAATIDSLTGHQESTIDTLVVACNGCNSTRHEGVELKLRKEPSRTEVYYSPKSIAWINSHPYSLENEIVVYDRQTRLDLSGLVESSEDKAAAHGAVRGSESTRPAAAEQSAALSDNDRSPAAARGAAPSTRKNQLWPGQDPFEDAPDWVTRPAEDVLGASAARGSESTRPAAAEQSAALSDNDRSPAAAAQETSDCNELIKPRSDLGQEGDGSRLSGSGRVGQERNRSGRRRRGKRGRKGGISG